MITGNEPVTGWPSTLDSNGDSWQNGSTGLTKREYFAAMAMQGILANNWQGYVNANEECDALARASVSFADSLIEQLQKPVI